MKMCNLQLLDTFGILEKYRINRPQSRFKNGRFYLNGLYFLNNQQFSMLMADLKHN